MKKYKIQFVLPFLPAVISCTGIQTAKGEVPFFFSKYAKTVQASKGKSLSEAKHGNFFFPYIQ
ncbi:MAG: hypothetical protein FWG27_00270 [Treponema sp.]|nr:hypothetical protein [Treponema sp.]